MLNLQYSVSVHASATGYRVAIQDFTPKSNIVIDLARDIRLKMTIRLNLPNILTILPWFQGSHNGHNNQFSTVSCLRAISLNAGKQLSNSIHNGNSNSRIRSCSATLYRTTTTTIFHAHLSHPCRGGSARFPFAVHASERAQVHFILRE